MTVAFAGVAPGGGGGWWQSWESSLVKDSQLGCASIEGERRESARWHLRARPRLWGVARCAAEGLSDRAEPVMPQLDAIDELAFEHAAMDLPTRADVLVIHGASSAGSAVASWL